MREFLARGKIEHDFVDVRKAPIDRAGALALVKKHQKAAATRGGKLIELEVKSATDAEIYKLFLGREGSLRAPTLSNGRFILGGFNAEAIKRLCAQK